MVLKTPKTGGGMKCPLSAALIRSEALKCFPRFGTQQGKAAMLLRGWRGGSQAAHVVCEGFCLHACLHARRGVCLFVCACTFIA